MIEIVLYTVFENLQKMWRKPFQMGKRLQCKYFGAKIQIFLS